MVGAVGEWLPLFDKLRIGTCSKCTTQCWCSRELLHLLLFIDAFDIMTHIHPSSIHLCIYLSIWSLFLVGCSLSLVLSYQLILSWRRILHCYCCSGSTQECAVYWPTHFLEKIPLAFREHPSRCSVEYSGVDSPVSFFKSPSCQSLISDCL